MQLSFLGQAYEASMPAIEAIATTETGIFLGQRYLKRQVTVSQRQQPTQELTYRGARYCR